MFQKKAELYVYRAVKREAVIPVFGSELLGERVCFYSLPFRQLLMYRIVTKYHIFEGFTFYKVQN